MRHLKLLFYFLLICMIMLSAKYQAFAQYKLHVGETEYLEVPDAPYGGFINTSNWTSGVGVAIEPGDNTYGATIRVTRYFTGTVTVRVTSTYTYYDYRGWPLGGQLSKSWVISCVPINVNFDQSDFKIKIGETATIKTSYPSSDSKWMSGIEYEWEIDEDWIATLNVPSSTRSATVTGQHVGKAVVTLNPIVGPEVKCNITVMSDPPTAIRLEPESMTLREGKTGEFTCVFSPENTSSDITWTSSNPEIAKISTRGTVTAVSEGTVTITAQTDNGLIATATVKVPPKPQSVELTGTHRIPLGYSRCIVPSLQPLDAVADFSWTTSDFTVANVDNKGNVKGLAPGQATVMVKTDNGLSASCEITVYSPDENMSADKVRARIGVLQQMINIFAD